MILWSYDHMVKWSCNHIVIMWSYDHEVIWSCKHMIVWSNITVLSVAILVQDFLGSSISGPNLFSTIIWSVLLYCCTKLVSSCCLNFIILSGMAPKALYIYWKFFALHDPPRFLMFFDDFLIKMFKHFGWFFCELFMFVIDFCYFLNDFHDLPIKFFPELMEIQRLSLFSPWYLQRILKRSMVRWCKGVAMYLGTIWKMHCMRRFPG